jgi:hypothetical protein
MITDEELKRLQASTPQWAKPTRLASEAQQKFMASLIEDREVPEDWLRNIKRLLDENKLTVPKASSIIDDLKKLPFKKKKPGADALQGLGAIPAGYYALPVVDQKPGGNDLVFYRIKKHKDHPNRGWVHIVLGPNEGEVPRNQVVPIANRIQRFGIGKAAELYGEKLGRCSQCNRQLTNRLSRELKIGPKCGGRVYADDWQDRVNNAREAIIERGEDPNESI